MKADMRCNPFEVLKSELIRETLYNQFLKLMHISEILHAELIIESDTKEIIDQIAGQYSAKTLAKKSIAGFKLREGMPIGVMVTLRGSKMYHFLDKLINVVLPAVRDFQGVKTTFDGQGNYNLGLKDWMVFPEVDYNKVDKIRGMNITFCTTAKTNDEAKALLQEFLMPFNK